MEIPECFSRCWIEHGPIMTNLDMTRSLAEMHRQLPIEMVILLPSHNYLPLVKHTNKCGKPGETLGTWSTNGSIITSATHCQTIEMLKKAKEIADKKKEETAADVIKRGKEIEDNQYPRSITWYFTRGIISRLFSFAQLVLFQFDHIK